ncbi:hypothetical protein [Actinopolymorpha rutila]|nr:hypothetical protein [Actinopolymorpha rutila]
MPTSASDPGSTRVRNAETAQPTASSTGRPAVTRDRISSRVATTTAPAPAVAPSTTAGSMPASQWSGKLLSGLAGRANG